MTTAENYLSAVMGATGGANKAASNCSARIRQSLVAGKVEESALTGAMTDLIRLAGQMADIDTETGTAVRLVQASPSNVKQASLLAAGKMRQIAQTGSASAGRIESAYRSGAYSIPTLASLGHIMRAGTTLVYAANEAARQLEVIAGKIKA